MATLNLLCWQNCVFFFCRINTYWFNRQMKSGGVWNDQDLAKLPNWVISNQLVTLVAADKREQETHALIPRETRKFKEKKKLVEIQSFSGVCDHFHLRASNVDPAHLSVCFFIPSNLKLFSQSLVLAKSLTDTKDFLVGAIRLKQQRVIKCISGMDCFCIRKLTLGVVSLVALFMARM